MNEPLITLRFFYRVEIRTLKVFYERKFEDILVAYFAYDNGNFLEAGSLRCLITSLTSNNFVLGPLLSYKNGLKDAILLNRISKFRKSILIEILSWLSLIRLDIVNRKRCRRLCLSANFCVCLTH